MATIQVTHADSSQLLRYALTGNGLFSIASGVAFILTAEILAPLLGAIPPPFLMGTGVATIAYAGLLLTMARRDQIIRRMAVVTIVLDLAWIVASVVLIATDLVPLTATGKWGVAIVAAIVALFADLQIVGVRRLRRMAGD